VKNFRENIKNHAVFVKQRNTENAIFRITVKIKKMNKKGFY
jgi:hypothetical protein